jgi:polyketide cyclase/dehydrase/lipid transport protein
MKVFKRVLLGLVTIVAILAVISLFLPKDVAVERSITMRGGASDVFPYVNNLKKFQEWSPWAVFEPDLELTFSGPEDGVGAKAAWDSDNPNVGTGSQEIIESRQDEYVKVALDFGDEGEGMSYFRILSEENRTRVVWGFQIDVGYNPIARYMGLMMDTWIGNIYQDGLERLKLLIETGSATSSG